MGWSRGISLNKCIAFALELCKAPLYIFREARFLKQKNPDIVHLNSSILWMSAIAARICHIPIVWHIREASDDSRFNLIRLMYAWFVRSTAARVICIGPQEYIKIGGKQSAKVVTIYNSLAESYFSNESYDQKVLRRHLDLPADSFLFLSLGGLSFRKGTYQFMTALQHLPEEYAAVLAGAKPDKWECAESSLLMMQHAFEDFLVARGIKRYFSWNYSNRVSSLLGQIDEHRLFLTGIVDDVQPYIKACDVVIFAGTTPHSARPVYEAWALKKPVIVFNSEVMRRDIEDGVDGILVKEHTAEALAKAIRELRKNPELAHQMGVKGYKKARERFFLQRNNEKILTVYKEVFGENSL